MDIPEAKTEILEGLIAEYRKKSRTAEDDLCRPDARHVWCRGVLFFPWSLARFLGMSSVVAFAWTYFSGSGSRFFSCRW
jgi:hypothetical protein